MKTDNGYVPIGTVRDILNHIFERVSVADDDDDINELENIVRGYVEQFSPKEPSSPEQIQDLEKEMGTEGKGNEPTENSDWGGEQMADLKNIMSGFKEGPDNRFGE